MHRVDLFPTHEYQGLKLRPGRPYPFGATVVGNMVNFSVYSRYATDCTLVLFHNREEKPFVEIPFFKEFRLGNVFSMIIFDLDYENIEYGFRFDLAAILGRDQNGHPMSNPPLLESLAHDPILGKTKLIAEAWDAGGLYQVGSFPSWGRWAEWNGKFRDSMRRFLKSDEGFLDVDIQKTDRITIRFEDGGVPFNPLEQKEPHTTLSWKQRRLGGLGIFLLRRKMDDVRYVYENHKNVLTIEKVI